MTASTRTDAASMAICAIRYCIGRRSYIVVDGVRWARDWGRRSAWVRGVIIQDLEALVKRADREPGAGMACLGDAGDEREWRAVLAELRAMEAGNG